MVTFWWGEEIWLKATRTNQAQHQSTQYLWESELDKIFESELDKVFLVFTFAEKCDYLSLLKVDSWYWTNLYLNDFLFLFLSYLYLGEMRNMITQACLKLQPCSDSWHWIQLVFKPSQAGEDLLLRAPHLYFGIPEAPFQIFVFVLKAPEAKQSRVKVRLSSWERRLIKLCTSSRLNIF